MAQKTTDCEHAISQEKTVQGFSFVLFIIVRVANRTDDQKRLKQLSPMYVLHSLLNQRPLFVGNQYRELIREPSSLEKQT